MITIAVVLGNGLFVLKTIETKESKPSLYELWDIFIPTVESCPTYKFVMKN